MMAARSSPVLRAISCWSLHRAAAPSSVPVRSSSSVKTWRVPAAVAIGAIQDALARDMLLAASVHGAGRLCEAGFLLRLVPDTDVAAEALAHAQRIARLAPGAARLNKRTFSALRQSTGEDPMAPLVAVAYDYADSDEHREGIAAFLAKRDPVF